MWFLFPSPFPLFSFPRPLPSFLAWLPTFAGNLLGDVIQAAVKPEALKLLAHLPRGSAETELMNIVPVFYVYDYLERTSSWTIFGSERTNAEITLLRKMKRGKSSIFGAASVVDRNVHETFWIFELFFPP